MEIFPRWKCTRQYCSKIVILQKYVVLSLVVMLIEQNSIWHFVNPCITTFWWIETSDFYCVCWTYKNFSDKVTSIVTWRCMYVCIWANTKIVIRQNVWITIGIGCRTNHLILEPHHPLYLTLLPPWVVVKFQSCNTDFV